MVFRKFKFRIACFKKLLNNLPEQSKFKKDLLGKMKFKMSVFKKFPNSWSTKMKFQKQLVEKSEVAQTVA